MISPQKDYSGKVNGPGSGEDAGLDLTAVILFDL